jgi:hypothetical protein
MKIAVKLIEALQYKLRMFGIPIDGPASMFCDNNSVVLNVTVPESTLSKKHNAIVVKCPSPTGTKQRVLTSYARTVNES